MTLDPEAIAKSNPDIVEAVNQAGFTSNGDGGGSRPNGPRNPCSFGIARHSASYVALQRSQVCPPVFTSLCQTMRNRFITPSPILLN